MFSSFIFFVYFSFLDDWRRENIPNRRIHCRKVPEKTIAEKDSGWAGLGLKSFPYIENFQTITCGRNVERCPVVCASFVIVKNFTAVHVGQPVSLTTVAKNRCRYRYLAGCPVTCLSDHVLSSPALCPVWISKFFLSQIRRRSVVAVR
jgi:hypothetical protein